MKYETRKVYGCTSCWHFCGEGEFCRHPSRQRKPHVVTEFPLPDDCPLPDAPNSEQMSDENQELLPCPFCGGEAFTQEFEKHAHFFVNMPDHPGSASVECSCGCGILRDTLDEAIAHWNRRAPTRPADDIAHEIWAAAQLAPGEGITDGVDRIAGLLAGLMLNSQEGQWFDAKAVLPPEDSNVLIWWLCAEHDDRYRLKPGIHFGKYLHGLNEWRPLGCSGNFNDEVTHWAYLPKGPIQPLPSPTKEE